MDWKDNTWRGEMENGDRWAAKWDHFAYGWLLCVTCTRHFDADGVHEEADIGLDRTFGPFNEDGAREYSATLDAGDIPKGKDGGPVSWDALAEEFFTPQVAEAPWSGFCGVRLFGREYGEILELSEAVAGRMTERGREDHEAFGKLFEVGDWAERMYVYRFYSDIMGTKACVYHVFTEKRWKADGPRPDGEGHPAFMCDIDASMADSVEVEIVTFRGERFLFVGASSDERIVHITDQKPLVMTSMTGERRVVRRPSHPEERRGRGPGDTGFGGIRKRWGA